jgi:hypothetical protein
MDKFQQIYGLYYQHFLIISNDASRNIIDGSRVMPLIVVSINDDSRGIIYDRRGVIYTHL